MTSKKVLIMDKYGPDFGRIAKALRPFGLALMWTESLKEGLDLLAQARPALLLAGQNLEGLADPTDLLGVIQAKRLPTQMVVIGQEPDFDRAMDWVAEGVFAVLRSPVQVGRLRRLAGRILDNLGLFETMIQAEAKGQEPGDLLIYKSLAGHTDVGPLLEAICDTAMGLTGADRVEAFTGPGAPQGSHMSVSRGDLRPSEGHGKTIDFRWMGSHLASVRLIFAQKVAADGLRQSSLDELSFAGALFLGQAFRLEEALMMASRDPLTGLANRRVFLDAINREYCLAKRHASPLSLLTLDLDHFKNVNDTFGHQTGDEVLKWVSGVIMEVVRQGDLPARIGGEEFSVILPRTSLDQAAILAQRLKDALAATPLPGRCPELAKPTVSQGLACIEHFLVNSPQDLIYCSDQAMYLAKREGRDTVRLATDLAGKNFFQDAQYVFQ
ncbi:MAG: diguanylate cyclase [Deltaproteobacteria bacterium]|nr:diguanylate cyclase [Deltaproteobacteria bacterium]